MVEEIMMKYKKFLQTYIFNFSKRFIILFAVLLCLWAIYLTNPLFLVFIQGDSMSPTFHHTDVTYFTKDISELSQGDIVVFKHDNDVFVKRIKAVPGSLYYRNNNLPTTFDIEYVNVFKNNYNFIHKNHIEMLQLEYDEFFVQGDNSAMSIDSKTYGPIRKKDIIGKYISLK